MSELQETFNRLFSYNPETGLLINKIKRNGGVKAGVEAGSVTTNQAGKSYRAVSVYGKHYKVHRVIWTMMVGSEPSGQIDHIDGDSLNNCWGNLRDVSFIDNMKNKRLRKNSKTGVQGVQITPYGRYRAMIGVGGKNIALGTYSTLEEAAQSRKEAEVKYGFHTNHGK